MVTDVRERSGPHSIPIPLRPPSKTASWVKIIGFTVVFNAACLLIFATQLLLWPLVLVNKNQYEKAIQGTKASFGVVTVLMCQWFAPTKFVITTEGMDESVFVKDRGGKVVGMKFPEKLVLVTNHQVYLDWWYLWSFTYFLGSHSSVLIMLKRSLKWLPFIGWGMQFFEFIFMARSWAADRLQLEKDLTRIGERAQRKDESLALMIFPEGTLVSVDTRPLSKKYADKIGIPDMTNVLLPRSTGLLFSLRSLAPYIPSLHLLDITIGYPGIPPAGYGQSYYTLRSVFFSAIPPPAVHLHLRLYQVQRDVPIGTIKAGEYGKADATPSEKDVFDKWLTERWREKDRLMDGFYEEGRFSSEAGKPVESSAEVKFGSTKASNGQASTNGMDAKEIPLEVRSLWDVSGAFCFLAPVWIVWGLVKVNSLLKG